jgi:hypothetical protein
MDFRFQQGGFSDLTNIDRNPCYRWSTRRGFYLANDNLDAGNPGQEPQI